MNVYKIIDQATDFGTFRSRNDLISFTIKILVYIIPAIIMGHYIDLSFKNKRMNDNRIMYYIFVQTILNIVILYLFILVLPRFISEFQRTISGGYFVVMYFSMQTNYIIMIKEYMNSL